MKFVIPKGKRYHKQWWVRLNFLNFKKKITREVMILYGWEKRDKACNDKLFGFGMRNSRITSARIAMRPTDIPNEWSIWSMVHETQSYPRFKYLGYVDTGEYFKASVEVVKGVPLIGSGYKFTFIGRSGSHEVIEPVEKPKSLFKHWPYAECSESEVAVVIKKP